MLEATNHDFSLFKHNELILLDLMNVEGFTVSIEVTKKARILNMLINF